MVLTISLVVIAALFLQSPPDSPPSAEIERVAAYLEDLAARSSRMRTEFDTIRHEWIHVPREAVWPTANWKSGPVVRGLGITWEFADGLLRIEERTASTFAADNASEQEGSPDRVIVWTGEGWFERINQDPFSRGHEDVTGQYRVYKRPKLLAAEYSYALFNGCIDWRSFATFLELAQAVRQYPVASIKSTEDTLVIRLNGTETLQLDITFETSPQLRLRRIEHQSLGAPGSPYAGLPLNRKIFEIDEWGEFGGIGSLPKTAWHFEGALRHPGLDEDKPVSVFAMKFVRRSAVALSDDDAHGRFVAPDVTVGFLVSDFRSNLSYVIGRSRIAVDRRMFDLDEPITALINDAELPDLLDPDAHPVETDTSVNDQDRVVDDDG